MAGTMIRRLEAGQFLKRARAKGVFPVLISLKMATFLSGVRVWRSVFW